MKTHTNIRPPQQPHHHEEVLPERVHDAYKLPRKLHEPTVCPSCGAVYHLGRWQWLQCPAGAEKALCSACHRIADRFPAGYLDIEGDFASTHHDELLQLLRHRETQESTEHPMERIMAIEENAGRMMVTTTGVHLARNLATALEATFQGSLQLQFSKDENLLRAYWRR